MTKKIIPCLDVKDGQLTKGVKFLNNQPLGDPVAAAVNYEKDGADELVIYDFSATADDRAIDFKTVNAVINAIKIPVIVGGGLKSIDDVAKVLDAGAAKVSLNSAAVRNPDLIDESAKRFGSAAILIGVDALKVADAQKPSGYEVMISGGRIGTGRDVVAWVKEAAQRGAGEFCLNSIDTDGVKNGYELNITAQVAEAVNLPVVASGGAGKPEHLYDVLTQTKASAALVASIVHYGLYSIKDLKNFLIERGVPVKL